MIYFLMSVSCSQILMTSLIMQMRVKTNFFNDIFNQMDKKLGKRTNFFLCFIIGSVMIVVIIYALN